MRTSTVTCATKDGVPTFTVDLDGTGRAQIDTPAGFLSHMLDVIASRAGGLDIVATGDTLIDYHHTVEDNRPHLGSNANASATNEASAVSALLMCRSTKRSRAW
jgi:imidazoleglycerol phosphate dehydratase HisB